MALHSTARETLKLIVDLVPEKNLMPAIHALEDFLVPNRETLQAMDDVKHNRNLLGPFHSIEEMNEALLNDDDDEV